MEMSKNYNTKLVTHKGWMLLDYLPTNSDGLGQLVIGLTDLLIQK